MDDTKSPRSKRGFLRPDGKVARSRRHGIERTVEQRSRIAKSATETRQSRAGIIVTHRGRTVRCEDIPKRVRGAYDGGRKSWPNDVMSESELIELWIEADGKCALTGLDFILQIDPAAPRTSFVRSAFLPSLDRRDVSIGYRQSNVRVVLAGVNFALNSFGDQVFDEICIARAKRISSAQRMLNPEEAPRSNA